jgi:hypothetical protein
VQRLFSTFPDSWPGLGLLVLRFAIALAPSAAVIDAVPNLSAYETWIVVPLLGILAACIVAGLGTPLVAPIFVVGVLTVSREADWPAWLAIVGGSLMMLGPGAWSLDALLYGR